MSKIEQHTVDILGTQFSTGFKPYTFQLSLALNSCLNRNNIICVRTGSGKTLISALITRYWYEKYQQEKKLNSFKVIFIVPTRNLVHQQCLVFEKSFKKEDVIEITENFNSAKILSQFDSDKKIFFLTPQKLINFLNETKITLEQISILFFDECHHTYDSHPYNEIMKIYYKSFEELKKKPLIVGLTASLGVGKSNSACNHLINLCANLDSEFISSLTNQEDIDDLNKNIPTPLNDIIIPIDSSEEINELKLKIKSVCFKLASLVKIKDSIIKLGRTEFDQFIHDTEEKASIQNNQDLIIVIKYLNELNLFYQRCEDFPIEFCIEKLTSFIKNSKVDEPTNVKASCESVTSDFLKSVEFKNFVNPKLISLIKNILKYHSTNSRGLVLVRTRNHTKALTQFLNQVKALNQKGISFKSLVGLGNVDGISMNENQQKDVLDDFLSGKFNVLVSTDIAQEGLDVPTCNYVIRYEFVSNEIGTVQSRGRSRALNGQCLLITAKESFNLIRETENRMKEKRMNEAIELLHRMKEEEFKEAFESKRMEIFQLVNRKLSVSYSDKLNLKICSSKVDVHCRDCGLFLFNGRNLRFREPSFYCICENFIMKLSKVDSEKKIIYCATKSCQRDLGRTVDIRKKSLPLYMIDIKSIKFNFPVNIMKSFSKWKKLEEIVSIQKLNF